MKCKSSKNILYLLMILAMSIFITFPITANAAVALGSGTSYHTHTGNSSSGGGCYGSKSESGAGMSNHEYWSGNDYVCEYHCAKCGANLGAYLINHWNDAHTAIISTESHTVGNNNHCMITTYSINCGISDSDTHTVTADNALTSNLSSYTLTISSSGITTLDASTPYLFTFVNTSGQIYTQNSTSNVYTISSTMGTGGTITVCVKDRVGSTVQLYSGAVSMHTHSYSKRVYTAATCTTGGNDQYYCSCGDSYLSPTPALGHAPSGWMTNGTHHWKVCTRSGCGAITYAVTEHSFTDWVTDSYSTCTVNGSKHRDCTICGYRQTEVISALGHIPSGWQKDALQHWIICTRTGCGVLTTAKENHTYNNWIVDVSPTCTTAGSRHRDCSVCNYRQTETLNALGHQWPTEYTYETSNGVEKGIAYKNCDRCSTRLETKWLNQIWVRYQDVTGTFGTYTKVVDRYCENGETVSWQRAADASYQGIEKSWVASNKAQIEYLTVYRNSVSLDLISWLDGVKKTDLGNYATADIYINGELVADNCNSYHNTNLLYGSSYEVKNVVTASGYTYNGIHAGTDSLSGTLNGNKQLELEFVRNSYTVTLTAGTGIASVSGSGTYRFEDTVSIDAAVKDGYTWEGWTGTHSFANAANTFPMPAENITITASATANMDTPYMVQHWQQNVDGGDEHTPENYTLADTDHLIGTTDTDVTPEVKSYTGFTAPDTVTVNVDGDGSLVVNYYYTRNSYTVSLSAGSGIASVNGTGTYRFEQEVTINATVMDGYTWAGWNGTHHFDDAATTFYMPAENISITASATANTDTPYKVQHWQQNIDGGDEHTPENYTLADTDDLTGTTDTNVTPAVKSYTGFTSPDTVTVNLDGDGSLVVNYYYTRNSYTVSLSTGTGIASVSGSGTYRFEEEVELNAELITEPPYQFVGWIGTDGFESEEIRRTITMPAYDVVLLAEGTLVQCVSFSAVYTEPVEVGNYINVREITVTAFYSNGKSANITGNTGLAFVDENGKLAAGNQELEAGNYTYAMLYEFNGFKTYSTVDISFVDTIAPVISNAEFLDEWTNELDVTFMVKDNSSGPLRYLLAYSRRYTRDELETMSLQEMVPGELTVNIRKNGSYTLYVVDPSGNMSEKAFTISSIDDIAPVMDVWLHFVDNTGNTRRVRPDEQIPDGSQYITFEVEAKDNETAIEKYRYKEDGAWSEWQTENTFAGIYLNGTYTFEAMDTCGNVSSKTIKLTMLSQKFAVHYLDVDQNGNTIKETIEDKPLGSSVSGAELGTIATTGTYYEGYDYISCDTAVVETSGATVHRYFKLHEFTITYMDADNNVLKTDKVPYGKTSSFGQDMSKPGYQTDQGNYSYVFKGWGNKNGDLVDTTMVKENLTLYPIYETAFHESAQPEDILYVEEDTGSTGYIPDLDSLDLTTIGKMPEYIDQTYEKESSNTGEIPSRYDNSLVVTNIPENKTALSRLFETLESAQGQTVVKTTAAVAGTTVGLSVISLLMQLLSGTGLIQSMIFGYVLLRKKVRYVQGAWMMSEEGMKYVDKFGRKLDVEVHGKQLIFKRKGKIYRAINTEELAEKLRTGRITYNQFEDAVSKSEVYTVFSKDVEIEVYNVKAQSGRIKKKMSGFSLSNNIRNMMRGIGEYSVRINNSGKQILFDVKYAMDNV